MSWFNENDSFRPRNNPIADLIEQLVDMSRRPIGDFLCQLITLWGEIYTGGSYSNYQARDRFLRWAIGGRVEEFIAWAVCHGSESSARALKVIFRVAAIREPEINNQASMLGRGFYHFSCGWLGMQLFGKTAERKLITVEDAILLAAIACSDYGLFCDSKKIGPDHGGGFAIATSERLKELKERCSKKLKALKIPTAPTPPDPIKD